ncbi:DUF624 domain-containing protein [Brachybacterium sp.]|uniref:DUF624 domain-containing protein n=1 Tax=Brachybacterium sp. TaxID=1891286 RepID=UPI002ED50DA2
MIDADRRPEAQNPTAQSPEAQDPGAQDPGAQSRGARSAGSGAPEKRRAPRALATRITEAVEHVYVVFRVQLMWLGLTLLGLVVVGISPASTAAAAALVAFRSDEKVRVMPLMWEVYRRELVSSNVRMLPLLLIQLGSLAMVWQAAVGMAGESTVILALGILAAISASWATVALAALAVSPRVRDQELLVSWRLAVLMPGALPLRSLGLMLGLFAWTVVTSLAWPLALLLGAGVAIDMAVALLSSRITLLLEDLGGRRPESD